jgi:hypothetical protein
MRMFKGRESLRVLIPVTKPHQHSVITPQVNPTGSLNLNNPNHKYIRMMMTRSAKNLIKVASAKNQALLQMSQKISKKQHNSQNNSKM